MKKKICVYCVSLLWACFLFHPLLNLTTHLQRVYSECSGFCRWLINERWEPEDGGFSPSLSATRPSSPLCHCVPVRPALHPAPHAAAFFNNNSTKAFFSYLKCRGKLKKRKSYCRKSLHQMHTKGNAQREVVQHTLCLSGQLLLHVKCEVSVWVKHGAESPFFDVHTQIQAFWDFWVSHKTASGHLHKHVHKVEVSQFYYTVAKLRGWGTPVVSHIMDFIHGGQLVGYKC